MASDIILPFTSAHPIQTKKSVLYAQLLRAKRLGSSRSAQDRGMNKIESLFRSNGYPAKMIRKTKFLVKSRNHRKPSETRKQSDPFSDSTFISLPFIDDHLSGKIESLVKNSKLPVRVAWQSGQTLSEKLTTSALEKPPCPAGNKKCHCCMSGLEGRCHSKNAVYMITCNLCAQKKHHISAKVRGALDCVLMNTSGMRKKIRLLENTLLSAMQMTKLTKTPLPF